MKSKMKGEVQLILERKGKRLHFGMELGWGTLEWNWGRGDFLNVRR
jgi:hypothetical protein